jgi:hypothetical protein
LHMDFKPYHGLVLGENFRRKRSSAHIVFDFNASGFGMDETSICYTSVF